MLRHIVRLAKSEHITSIADFLAARYGKSFGVASLATCIAAVGSIPYIALQLKAVSGSVGLVMEHYGSAVDPSVFIFGDISLPVAAVLAVFAILFGTRHTDATEHQNGLILAVALGIGHQAVRLPNRRFCLHFLPVWRSVATDQPDIPVAGGAGKRFTIKRPSAHGSCKAHSAPRPSSCCRANSM
ncbi:hypothetical protein HED48_05385 [Ochrobactrum intermedium]|nr:hypothetical protein [Brucella intermedia]